jgi:hypothetical protein
MTVTQGARTETVDSAAALMALVARWTREAA